MDGGHGFRDKVAAEQLSNRPASQVQVLAIATQPLARATLAGGHTKGNVP